MFKNGNKTLLFLAATEEEAKQQYICNSLEYAHSEDDIDYKVAYLARQCAFYTRYNVIQTEEKEVNELTYTTLNPVKAIYLRHADRYGLGILEEDISQIVDTGYVEWDAYNIANLMLTYINKANFNFSKTESAKFVDKIARYNTLSRPTENIGDDYSTGVGAVAIKMEPANESVIIYRKVPTKFVDFVTPADIKELKPLIEKVSKLRNKAYKEKLEFIDKSLENLTLDTTKSTAKKILISAIDINISELIAKSNSKRYAV